MVKNKSKLRGKDQKTTDKQESLTQKFTEKQLQQWTDDLGKSSFKQREVALQQLIKTGHHALTHLEKAAQSDDSEVRSRVKRILVHLGTHGDANTYKAARALMKKTLSKEQYQKIQKAQATAWLKRAKATTEVDDEECVYGVILVGRKQIKDNQLAHFEVLTEFESVQQPLPRPFECHRRWVISSCSPQEIKIPEFRKL